MSDYKKYILKNLKNIHKSWWGKISQINLNYKQIYVSNQNKNKFPEIIEAHRLTGEGADYQLKIICPSMEAYDILQQQLIGEIDFTAMSTKISLKQIKNEYSLPLSHLEKLNKLD